MSISMKMNTWRRKDDSVMIYVNNTRHVSIGITPESGIDEPKTDDHKKVIESFIRAIRQSPGLLLILPRLVESGLVVTVPFWLSPILKCQRRKS